MLRALAQPQIVNLLHQNHKNVYYLKLQLLIFFFYFLFFIIIVPSYK